ncbi:ATP synthase subunit b [Candidatus Hartigia pinicola]|nr:ATP synthase subunit b [Candidatus Hartigia pinicola]
MNLNATILGQDIAFILFVLFCIKYVWPPIIKTIENRQKEIADGLFSAESAKKNLESAQTDIINQLKTAKLNAGIIIEQANMQRNKMIEKAKVDAQIERLKILKQAQTDIDFERKRMYEELRKQVTMLAIAAAEKIIERSINEEISTDIINKVICKL